jgi:hypothetical protein
MKTKKELISKQKDHAFRKDVYLLGKDKGGIKYWLESPSWDCDWYWGFGYVETYKQNWLPSKAKDINGHRHINGILGPQEKYDFDKKAFVKAEHVSNLIDSELFAATTFTESESWQLTELFKQFYLLKDMAAFCGKDLPGCHVTTSPVNHGDLKAWESKINKELIPAITAKIIEILSPE